MADLLDILRSPDGLVLALIIFSSGIGIGAAVVQINSILNRQASDAVTSVITWMLLLAFSLATAYHLWYSSDNLVLPMVIGALAASAAAGLAVSIGARRRLAEVENARLRPSEAELQQSFAIMRTARDLRQRIRAAREQRRVAG